MINKQIKQKACSFGDNRGKKIEKSKWKLLISLSPVSLNNSQRMFSFGCKWWRCCFLTRTQWLLHINPCMQGRYHEFEGGWSMHWKVVGGGGQYSKNTKIWKKGGCMTLPQLLWWLRPCLRANVTFQPNSYHIPQGRLSCRLSEN